MTNTHFFKFMMNMILSALKGELPRKILKMNTLRVSIKGYTNILITNMGLLIF